MLVKYDEYFIGGKVLNSRAQVWCLLDELTDNEDGTFSISDSDISDTLGFGSEIYVIDVPCMILFWDNNDGVAYNWSGAEVPDSQNDENIEDNEGGET